MVEIFGRTRIIAQGSAVSSRRIRCSLGSEAELKEKRDEVHWLLFDKQNLEARAVKAKASVGK
jgi:hypothetical protein